MHKPHQSPAPTDPVELGREVVRACLGLGFAAAGSTLFWKAHANPRPLGPEPPAPAALPFVAIFGLLACLVGLTVFAGPVMRSLNATSAGLYMPAPYIAANTLPAQD